MDISQEIKEVIRDIPDFPEKGIVFKDITSLLLNASLSRKITKALVEQVKPLAPTAICAIESRGFLFAVSMAQELNIPLVLIRKKGKLPGETISVSYDLEYGSAIIEMHAKDLPKNSRVLIHDDLLATGGTAAAAASLIQEAGSSLAGFSFLINLSFLEGKNKLTAMSEHIHYLAEF